MGVTTLRQRTDAAGAAALAVAERALAQVLPAPVRAARPPAVRQVRRDATTVPLVGGGWTAVQRAVCAARAPGPPREDGGPTLVPQTTSAVARWEPAAPCGQTSTLAAQQRGIAAAAVVVSPTAGAAWIQGHRDLIAPQASRVLDFPHAVEHRGVLAARVYGAGSAAAGPWVAAHRPVRPARGADARLPARAACQARGPCPSALVDAAGRTPPERRQRAVPEFARRTSPLASPAFRQHGDPSGSGAVASGQQVVLGARCTGAGQHGASPHRNPLLAVRCASCTDRWASAWPTRWAPQGQQARAARAAAPPHRRAARSTARAPVPVPQAAPVSAVHAPAPVPAVAPPRPTLVVDGRPTAAHPWRTPFLPTPHRATG